MRTPRGRRETAGLVLVAGLAIATPAAADPACANAFESGQRAKLEKRLKSARAEFLVCSKSDCQAWMKKECLGLLGEVEAAMPSIVVSARGADGRPVRDVRVTIDGSFHSVTESIALDPGEHKLVVDAPNVAKIEQTFHLREGERERKIELTLAETKEPPRVEPPRQETPKERPVPVLFWVLGGAGLVTAGVGVPFQISGMSKTSDLDTCRGQCTDDRIDSARATLWTGNVLLGASVLALVGAAIVYFTR